VETGIAGCRTDLLSCGNQPGGARHGCCDGDHPCQRGTDDQNCSSGGQFCVFRNGFDGHCFNQTCQCGPGNGPNGCCPDAAHKTGLCYAAPDALSCGTRGAQRVACPTNQTCNAQRVCNRTPDAGCPFGTGCNAPGQCDCTAANCPHSKGGTCQHNACICTDGVCNGCCQDGRCTPGNTPEACALSGDCAVCAPGEFCLGGACCAVNCDGTCCPAGKKCGGGTCCPGDTPFCHGGTCCPVGTPGVCGGACCREGLTKCCNGGSGDFCCIHEGTREAKLTGRAFRWVGSYSATLPTVSPLLLTARNTTFDRCARQPATATLDR
jgi:hypothetical protein